MYRVKLGITFMINTVLIGYKTIFRRLVWFRRKSQGFSMNGWLFSGDQSYSFINVHRLRSGNWRFLRTSMFHGLDFSSVNSLFQLCQRNRFKSESGSLGVQSSDTWSLILQGSRSIKSWISVKRVGLQVVLKYCELQVVSNCLVKAQRCDRVSDLCRQGDFCPVPWMSLE